jgi:hypothetical protein
MEIDALRLALLAVCAPEHTLPHRIHGELEHWLNRPLATTEIDAALAELEARGSSPRIAKPPRSRSSRPSTAAPS